MGFVAAERATSSCNCHKKHSSWRSQSCSERWKGGASCPFMLVSVFSWGCMVTKYHVKVSDHQERRQKQVRGNSQASFWSNESQEIEKGTQVVKIHCLPLSVTWGRRLPCWRFLFVSYGWQDLAVEPGVRISTWNPTMSGNISVPKNLIQGKGVLRSR